MSYTKYLLCFLACFIGFHLFSQSNFESLGESTFALNKRFSSHYKFNFALRSRYYMYRDDAISFENRQLDLVHFSTFNLDYNNAISLGVQYRLRESIDGGSNELRLTQQFNYTKKNHALRFGHRVRLEQRILDELTILRSRYRLAVDFPLNGEKLNVGEGYLVTSIEGLLSLAEKLNPELDYRTTTQIGWLISETLKLQLGLEYRFEVFNIDTEEKLFFLTSVIFKV
ncbi:DUF2490 domain-containing protein [Winogradskyella sp.]|uniref:DUF2490 domain-containing protein n=1 Tax=Winogradskyella sp. TaxID=1883156 RepID=UPI00261CB6D9|nr:DUF2490 domain-containing protein [Winogradskyella sp.]